MATEAEACTAAPNQRSLAESSHSGPNDFADSKGSLYVRGGEEVVDVANREITLNAPFDSIRIGLEFVAPAFSSRRSSVTRRAYLARARSRVASPYSGSRW